MIVTLDVRNMRPPLTTPFHGATEMLAKRLASVLAAAGHQVHVVSNEPAEAVVDGAYWHTAERFPSICDVLIAFDRADRLPQFRYQRAHVFATAVEMPTGGLAGCVDSFVTLSRAHGVLLQRHTAGVDERQIEVIPPGVDIPDAADKMPGRIIWCHSPDRGLVHLARMWPEVLKADPLASIRVTYNVAEYIERNRWLMDERGQQALEIERWIADNPDTVIAGVTGYEDVRLEQARSELCAYPMDPLNAGVGIHALAVQECAAAGCALLLSYHEGLPEVFGECADFLELPVNYTDWVREIADILQDGGRRIAMQDKALQWARRHPWERWEAAWRGLVATGHYAEVAA